MDKITIMTKNKKCKNKIFLETKRKLIRKTLIKLSPFNTKTKIKKLKALLFLKKKKKIIYKMKNQMI